MQGHHLAPHKRGRWVNPPIRVSITLLIEAAKTQIRVPSSTTGVFEVDDPDGEAETLVRDSGIALAERPRKVA